MNTQSDAYLSADMPAAYRIRVRGRVKASWTDRFDGMTISSSAQTQHIAVTTLSGTVPDQAALIGVLNALYALRLTLLTVECLEVQAAEDLVDATQTPELLRGADLQAA
jgi:hypothetical protein